MSPGRAKPRAPIMLAVAVLAVVPAAPSAASGQLPPDSGPVLPADTATFEIVQDGVAIGSESFIRTPRSLHTALLLRSQGLVLARVDLTADARVERLEVEAYAPGDSPTDSEARPVRSSAAVFRAEQVLLEDPIGSPAPGRPVPVPPGTIPYVNPGPSLLEQIIRRALALGGREVAVPVWTPGPDGGTASEAVVKFDGKGDATIALGGARIRATHAPDGRLLSASIPAGSLVIERN